MPKPPMIKAIIQRIWFGALGKKFLFAKMFDFDIG